MPGSPSSAQLSRFRRYGDLDDIPISDGDRYFLGMYSRWHPTSLKPGQLHFSGNGRMERGTWKVRAGLAALSTDINLNNPPLIVGQFSLAADVPLTSITRVTTTATATSTSPHGYLTGNYVNIRGATGADGLLYNGDFTITKTGASTFTYTMTGTPTGSASGTLVANKGPIVYNSYPSQVVGSGDYADVNTNTEGIIIASTTQAFLYRYGTSTLTLTYPAGETCIIGQPCCIVQFLNKVYMFRGYSTTINAPLAVSGITQALGTATVTTTSAHGLSTGNWVTIAGAGEYGYNIVGQITVTGANTFTYAVNAATVSPATGTITARPCQPPMYWDLNTTTLAFQVVPEGENPAGAPLIDMPCVDWGMYFKNRMVVPYSRDELLLSDIDDAGTYDPTTSQFRIQPGTNDWLIGAFPYQDARLLVLYRKSVQTLIMDGTDLTISQTFEITRNFGCLARRTVANCGPYIAWLSDIGVVRMQVTGELSLINNQAPLSDPIQDQFANVNWAYASNAVATFWNNRYYLAVPTGTSTINNTVFVFNFLNDAWESVDTYPQGWDALNFHIISYNGTKRIFAVSTAGYVTLLEQNNYDEFGAPGMVQDFAINGSMQTRNYLCDTFDMKKVKRFQLDGDVTIGDVVTGSYVLENPDYSLAVLNYTATQTTGVTLRVPVGRRGISGRLELTTSSGRPEVHSITIETALTSRQTLNYS